MFCCFNVKVLHIFQRIYFELFDFLCSISFKVFKNFISISYTGLKLKIPRSKSYALPRELAKHPVVFLKFLLCVCLETSNWLFCILTLYSGPLLNPFRSKSLQVLLDYQCTQSCCQRFFPFIILSYFLGLSHRLGPV